MLLSTNFLKVFASFLLTTRRIFAVEFPNKITGTPTVECLVDAVKLTVTTTSGNPSHMFVKNRHAEPTCVVRNNNMMQLKHEECGLTRERSLTPPGVFYRACIIVQLHPQFITKVDRTFCASCFYMEAVKDVSQELVVSLLPSTEVQMSLEMPTCTYTIRRGSPTGPEIRFATVGEPVYHVWDCPSESYGMLVQNCYVDDGQGNRILIIDANGCGVDRYIIQTPKYNPETTMANQESHVFKFADKTITRFTCQIKVCIKAGGSCDDVTPPKNCPAVNGGGPGGQGGYGGSGGGGGAFPSPAPFPIGPQPLPPGSTPPTGGIGGGQYGPSPAGSNIGGGFRRQQQNFNSFNQWGRFPRMVGTFLPTVNQSMEMHGPMSPHHDPMHDDKPQLPIGEDVIDVSGELIVLEEINTADMQMFADFLQTMKEKKQPITSKEGAVCIPTLGFVVIMILLSVLTLVGLVLTVALLMRTQAAAVMPLVNTIRKRRGKF